MSRPKTDEEIRDEFLRFIRNNVYYYAEDNERNKELSTVEKLDMLVFEILVAIDGYLVGLPGYELRALPNSKEEIEDRIKENGSPYYGEDSPDIAGNLHEQLYTDEYKHNIEEIKKDEALARRKVSQ